MLYVVLMVTGLLIGLSAGRDGNALWGLLFGLVLAHMIRLSQRLGRLERELKARSKRPDEAPPAKEAALVATEPSDTADALDWARESEAPSPREEPEEAEASEEAQEPQAPSLLVRGIGLVKAFFTTGNPLVRTGALVLFVAVAFLLKYISERVQVSIELRLLGIAFGGLAILVTGVLMRVRRPGFALPFQGAGIGVLYLTTYAAVRLYPVIPPGVALLVLLLVVAVTIGLALWQDTSTLASFGVVGGFLAPVLTSTGQGSHVELFSYYLVLNVAIGTIAWFRAWRWLNWLGFVFTFGIASMWGAEYYRPEHFATTEPFLVAHVALYIAIAVLFAVRQPPRLKGLVDGTLVFGTPLVGFTLQALLLEDRGMDLAASAAILGIVYLVLRQGLLGRDREHFSLLGQSFLGLGVGFLTLAVPLAFDARVTSAMWTLEGAAIAWVGIHQSASLRRWAGYLLMLVGSLAYLLENEAAPGNGWALLNADYLGIAIVSASFLFVADQIRRRQCDPGLPHLAAAFWVYGAIWFWLGGINELQRQLAGAPRLLSVVIYLGAGAIACAEYGRRQAFGAARGTAVFGALFLALTTLAWRVPETGLLLLNANSLAAAGVVAALTAVGVRYVEGSEKGLW
ncbi:MAG: DUF2339 domain-containing protein, partial [Xanthomonadales bacterium]|nr:DUF2339 domain-containing protein [Xanthomonadales bacterium]